MLDGTFFPEIRQFKPDFIFMQDNASIHKAELVMDYLKEENVNPLNWPPRSPDLNPIENIWSKMLPLVNNHMLKRRVTTAHQLQLMRVNNFFPSVTKVSKFHVEKTAYMHSCDRGRSRSLAGEQPMSSRSLAAAASAPAALQPS